jgi:hypothetical protein
MLSHYIIYMTLGLAFLTGQCSVKLDQKTVKRKFLANDAKMIGVHESGQIG